MSSPAGRYARSSAFTTTALATVLLALTVLVIGGIWQTRQAAGEQARVLGTARTLQAVQIDVSVEMLYMRQYRLEPSTAVHDRYTEAADSAEAGLTELAGSGDTEVQGDAETLLARQLVYREAADRLLAAVMTGDDGARQIDLNDVTPAYYSLQQDVDEAAEKYRSRAEDSSARMQSQLTGTLIGTSIGFVLGLALLGLIHRSMLGQQRSLARVASDNERRALRDALTGVANRTALSRDLETLTARLARETDSAAAALVIDLDGFKAVNDSLGHAAGDLLLVEMARRLAALTRDGDTVARTGGDEFVVLLSGVRGADDAAAIALRALTSLRLPVDLAGQRVSVGASIGVAVAPVHGTCETIMQNADHAMYRAKKSAAGVAVYDAALDSAWSTEAALQQDLVQALADGDPGNQLQLYYQPQLDLATGRVTGVEALVRWQHPEQGLLPPAVLLPLVDRSSLDAELTALLLDRAVQQAVAWRAAGHDWTIAVNVTPTCLCRPEFPALVSGILVTHGAPGHLLRLELVETSAVGNTEQCAAAVLDLRALGVGVSLDDFGTGFSSLSHLHTLDVDELKVDREFVAGLQATGDDRVLRMAARIGTEMGLRVVAEGVEDLAILPILQALGCTDAQGHALVRPVPAEALPARVDELHDQLSRAAART